MQKEVFGPGTRIVGRGGRRHAAAQDRHRVVPLLNLGAGVPPTKRIADGEIVFVGYGLTLANPKRDDFAGLSLAGEGRGGRERRAGRRGLGTSARSSKGRRRSASGSRRSSRSDPRP